MNKSPILTTIVLAAWALPMPAAHAGDPAFPHIVPALDGAPPEGFTIGKGHTAYNGSIDGSIYKVDLRTGLGEILVAAEPDFDWQTQCHKLGMRVDPRSNYLFVAGCINGDAYVFDADTGAAVMKYQLAPQYESTINDIAITRNAVYFTDYAQPRLFSLPLSANGRIPAAADAATAIPLTGDFETGDMIWPVYANGIAATPDGDTLIVANSGTSKIFRVDPATGHADEIIVDPPLMGLAEGGFIDAIILRDGVLFLLTSDVTGTYPPIERIQVVVLDDDLLGGTLVGSITDPDLDGVASGAFHGDSLYVNNARYFDYPGPSTEYWITKLNIYDIQ